MAVRKCSKCGQLHPATEEFFYLKSPGKLAYWCKRCKRTQVRHGKHSYIRFYSLVDKISRHITQCMICGDSKSLAIDHDHVTKTFRGVLCSKCNSALGLFDDDPERLELAAQYLRASQKSP